MTDSTNFGKQLPIPPPQDGILKLFYKKEKEFYKKSTYSTNSRDNSTKFGNKIPIRDSPPD
jgi:hypothetical protein